MSKGRSRRLLPIRRNRGWFLKGHDPRRRRGFTTEECRAGYVACLKKHPHLAAQWILIRLKTSCGSKPASEVPF